MLFQLTEKYIQEALKESEQKYVLLDFYGSWCARCRILAPELEELSDQFAQQISVYCINIDTEPGLSEYYQITEVPTVLLLQDGHVSARWEKDISIRKIKEKIRLS